MMRNIKRFLTVALLLCLIVAAVVGLSSCEKEEIHVHKHVETIEKAASCLDTGLARYTCECGDTYTVRLEALGHTEVVDPAVEPGCVEVGYTEGKHCSVCGEVLVAQSQIKPNGHNLSGEATCTTDKKCLDCGKIYVKAYHVGGEAASCTTDQLCIYCGEVVTLALGHTAEADEAVEPTCYSTGLTEGSHCSVCNTTIVAQEVVPTVDHSYDAVVTDPTCTAKGYTTYTCSFGCGYSYVGNEVEPIPHVYDDVVTAPTCTAEGYTTHTCKFGCNTSYVDTPVSATGHDMQIHEGEDGFYLECANGCGHTEDTDAPVADSYKATIDGSFTSSKTNVLTLKYASVGAAGIYTNGSVSKENEYVGGIGGLDKGAYYVGYEFVMEKPGTVDIIWNISGNYWKSGVGNAGIDDMAKYMAITIDGKPVDISGLELPKGDGVNAHEYWNMQQFIIKDVVLDAGVHTFYCDIDPNDNTNTSTTSGGLNVGDMIIQSSKPVSVRPIPTATSAKVVLDGERVYYVLTLDNCVYTADEIELFDGDTVLPIVSLETDENNITTIKVDVTDRTVGQNFSPHLRFGELGINYINGVNINGDVRDENLQYTNYEYVSLGDKHYVIYNHYEMPAVKVYGKTMLNTAYDLVEEDGKPVLLLTYMCLGFDENTAKFFDGSKTVTYTVERNGAFVVYHIDLTGTAGANFYMHLSINGQKWNGKANNTSNDGNVLVPDYSGTSTSSWHTYKSITVNGTQYVLGRQYAMIVIGH